MTKPIDRAALKAQARELLQTAQVSPKGMTALYCICLFLLSLMEALFPGPELVSTFLSILTTLAGWILAAGFALYCMDIRRRERSEYAVLFDGFSFTGKIKQVDRSEHRDQPVCVPVVHAVCIPRHHRLLPLQLRPL